jgi:tetratricopeptide (TPR) repeat protein
MNFRLIITSLIIFLGSTYYLVLGQSIQEGLKFMEMEQYGNARKTFNNLAASNPQSAEFQYYLGDFYVRMSQIDTSADEGLDTALVAFNKGIMLDPKFALNYVGLGAVKYIKNSWQESADNFKKALDASRSKNSLVLTKIGEAYLYKGKKDVSVAIPQLEKAVSLDAKNTEAILLLGDAYLLNDDGNASRAIKQYNNALSVNPKLAKAHIKVGKTYLLAKNYDQPLNYYNEAIKVDPNYSPAYRERAELYFKLKSYRDKAAAEYRQYLGMSDGNFKSKFRFAYICFSSQDYTNAVDILNGLMKEYKENRLVYRLSAYCNYEVGAASKDSVQSKALFAAGLDNLNKFFTLTPDTNKYIVTDYEYLGKLLIKTGNDSLGAQNLLKVASKDASKFEIYNDLAKLAKDKKKYLKAGDFYTLYFASKKPGLNDLITWGTAYYNGGDFVKSDTIFSQLIRTKPDEPIGYKWKAFSNQALDKDSKNGKAMPHFEKFIEVATAKDVTKYKNDIIRGYTYLGTYYLNVKNQAKSTEYWKKILELDPADPNATMMKKNLKF